MSDTICPLVCQNGGTCTIADGGSFYCDCNADGGTTNPPVVAAGINCEYLATTWCVPEELFSAVSFCTNGGECNGEALPGGLHVGCSCLTNFEGEHCEYIEGTAPDLTEPPVSPPSSPPSIPLNTITVCPDGRRCEQGSACTANSNTLETYICDCASLEDVYAGLYCQHIATSFCTRDPETSADNFCTNDGICNSDEATGEALMGCTCSAGYEGDHCEFEEGTKPATFPSSSVTPTSIASSLPSSGPTQTASAFPSNFPSVIPSLMPSTNPSLTSFPSSIPSSNPSSLPSSSAFPSYVPSVIPSSIPTSSSFPSSIPSSMPSSMPSSVPMLRHSPSVLLNSQRPLLRAQQGL